ncbi:UPF0739 protein C1orf74-like [Patiria miniata]|uniref:Uncharacterized protein n=1 Tax=Patiria miniata TaxID=46514 RepID=A0A914AUU6_PATMI|nr:UPF0739 protein C1orf74-like [Patiria miniata]XP_038067458.1 UPF0739 protein C1orf74-like [Patiria miniata]
MEAEHIVKRYLGKTAKKNWKHILLSIEGVSSGIKPSFLYDYSCLEPSQLSKMTADLAASGFLAKENLQVLGLGQDAFLTNISCVKDTVDEIYKALEKGRQVVVDVSAHLEQPKLLEDETVQRIKDQVGDVLAQLQDPQNNSQAVLELHPQQGWNLSTVFGVLLGYPVVYWYSDVENCSNCLSMIPLRVYRVSIESDKPNSSSSAKYEFPNRHQTAFKPGRVDDTVHEHHIYSFSVPGALLPRFQDRIDDWFQTVQERTHIKLRITCESVTLPAVAL